GPAAVQAALKPLLDILLNLPKYATAAAQGTTSALNQIQVNPVHVPVVVDTPAGSYVPGGGEPVSTSGGGGSEDTGRLVANGGGLMTAAGLQRFHSGSWSVGPVAFARLGGDEFPAILQAGEAVIQKSAVNMIGPAVMRAINAGNIGGAIAGLSS